MLHFLHVKDPAVGCANNWLKFPNTSILSGLDRMNRRESAEIGSKNARMQGAANADGVLSSLQYRARGLDDKAPLDGPLRAAGRNRVHALGPTALPLPSPP